MNSLDVLTISLALLLPLVLQQKPRPCQGRWAGSLSPGRTTVMMVDVLLGKI